MVPKEQEEEEEERQRISEAGGGDEAISEGGRATADESASAAKSEGEGLESEEVMYAVEKLLKVRRRRGQAREFLVKWLGYADDESTWEPEHTLPESAVASFFEQNLAYVSKISDKDADRGSRGSFDGDSLGKESRKRSASPLAVSGLEDGEAPPFAEDGVVHLSSTSRVQKRQKVSEAEDGEGRSSELRRSRRADEREWQLPPRRETQSCRNCLRRKRVCDRKLPGCQRCLQSGWACKYPRRRGMLFGDPLFTAFGEQVLLGDNVGPWVARHFEVGPLHRTGQPDVTRRAHRGGKGQDPLRWWPAPPASDSARPDDPQFLISAGASNNFALEANSTFAAGALSLGTNTRERLQKADVITRPPPPPPSTYLTRPSNVVPRDRSRVVKRPIEDGFVLARTVPHPGSGTEGMNQLRAILSPWIQALFLRRCRTARSALSRQLASSGEVSDELLRRVNEEIDRLGPVGLGEDALEDVLQSVYATMCRSIRKKMLRAGKKFRKRQRRDAQKLKTPKAVRKLPLGKVSVGQRVNADGEPLPSWLFHANRFTRPYQPNGSRRTRVSPELMQRWLNVEAGAAFGPLPGAQQQSSLPVRMLETEPSVQKGQKRSSDGGSKANSVKFQRVDASAAAAAAAAAAAQPLLLEDGGEVQECFDCKVTVTKQWRYFTVQGSGRVCCCNACGLRRWKEQNRKNGGAPTSRAAMGSRARPPAMDKSAGKSCLCGRANSSNSSDGCANNRCGCVKRGELCSSNCGCSVTCHNQAPELLSRSAGDFPRLFCNASGPAKRPSSKSFKDKLAKYRKRAAQDIAAERTFIESVRPLIGGLHSKVDEAAADFGAKAGLVAKIAGGAHSGEEMADALPSVVAETWSETQATAVVSGDGARLWLGASDTPATEAIGEASRPGEDPSMTFPYSASEEELQSPAPQTPLTPISNFMARAKAITSQDASRGSSGEMGDSSDGEEPESPPPQTPNPLTPIGNFMAQVKAIKTPRDAQRLSETEGSSDEESNSDSESSDDGSGSSSSSSSSSGSSDSDSSDSDSESKSGGEDSMQSGTPHQQSIPPRLSAPPPVRRTVVVPASHSGLSPSV